MVAPRGSAPGSTVSPAPARNHCEPQADGQHQRRVECQGFLVHGDILLLDCRLTARQRVEECTSSVEPLLPGVSQLSCQPLIGTRVRRRQRRIKSVNPGRRLPGALSWNGGHLARPRRIPRRRFCTPESRYGTLFPYPASRAYGVHRKVTTTLPQTISQFIDRQSVTEARQ